MHLHRWIAESYRHHQYMQGLSSSRAADRTHADWRSEWVLRIAAGASAALFLPWPAARPQTAVPLPDVQLLRQTALVTSARTAEQRERYECRARMTTEELDGKGRTRKSAVTVSEFFFVNSHLIRRDVLHDGKPLTESEARRQDERLRKEVEKASHSARDDHHGEIDPTKFLRAAKLTHERRIIVGGRPTIVFDIEDDPGRKTSDIMEKVISSMRGTLSVDERSGHIQDVNAVGVRDIKIAGGLLADIHKGLSVHLIYEPQQDGIWLLRNAWGRGDARVALLLNRGGNFHEELLGCHLFQVSSEQADAEVSHSRVAQD